MLPMCTCSIMFQCNILFQPFLRCKPTLWSSSSCPAHQATGWRTTSSSSSRLQEELHTTDSSSPSPSDCLLKITAPALFLFPLKTWPRPAPSHKPTVILKPLLPPLPPPPLLLHLLPVCFHHQLRLLSPHPPFSLSPLLWWPLHSVGPYSRKRRTSLLLPLHLWFFLGSPRIPQPPSRDCPCTQSRLWPYSHGRWCWQNRSCLWQKLWSKCPTRTSRLLRQWLLIWKCIQSGTMKLCRWVAVCLNILISLVCPQVWDVLLKGFCWFEFQVRQTCKVNGLSSEERKDECSPSPQRDRTPAPLTGPPKQNSAGKTW